MDLDKLSDGQYAILVLISTFLLSAIFGLIPYFFVLTLILNMIRIITKRPIHANGLNICYLHTILFYLLIFISLKMCLKIVDEEVVFVMFSIIMLVSGLVTSEDINIIDKLKKATWGKIKKNNDKSKYAELFRLIKFEPTNKIICDFEKYLKDTDTFRYTIFKAVFRDNLTWDEVEELMFLNRTELNKEVYGIYCTLQYPLNLKRL